MGKFIQIKHRYVMFVINMDLLLLLQMITSLGGDFGTLSTMACAELTQRHSFCHGGSYFLMKILTLVGEKFLERFLLPPFTPQLHNSNGKVSVVVASLWLYGLSHEQL